MGVPSQIIPRVDYNVNPKQVYAVEPRYYIAMDTDLGGKLIYIGKALPNSAKSAAVWQIRKLFYSGDNVTDIKYANGDQNFDNIWDNRGLLSYS